MSRSFTSFTKLDIALLKDDSFLIVLTARPVNIIFDQEQIATEGFLIFLVLLFIFYIPFKIHQNHGTGNDVTHINSIWPRNKILIHHISVTADI